MAAVLTLQSGSPRADLDEAARIVRCGGVLAIPTESFYALAASIWNEAGLRRVWSIKGRSEGKPILALIADRSQLAEFVIEITPTATLLMEHFWPGPLTLVMRASPSLSEALTAGTGTIGVRQPAYPELVRLLRYTGPLTGTSANRSGQPPVRTAEEVQAIFGSELDLILNGGQTSGGMPSTLVDATGPVRVLREGPVMRDQLLAVLARSGIVLQ